MNSGDSNIGHTGIPWGYLTQNIVLKIYKGEKIYVIQMSDHNAAAEYSIMNMYRTMLEYLSQNN